MILRLFWYLSAVCIYVYLFQFAPPYLLFPRLYFHRLHVHDDGNRIVLKIHCVRAKIKHSIAVYLFIF